jgi:N-methylhydantoinase A
VRVVADTGGTFTDLIVDTGTEYRLFKSPTTPADPTAGVLSAVALAAADAGMPVADFLSGTELFIHGTTRAINAVLTGTTARTALLTTRGHPDVLLLREGGRVSAFDWSGGYPDGYIPRSLTFEVPERIGSQGEVVVPLDEPATVQIIEELAALDVEAVAVCLLWSIVNPVHERRVGELLEAHLPRIPYTLSSVLNPTMREYRRASCAAIDASLKPLMVDYLGGLDDRLRAAGFAGRLLMVTSNGGLLDAQDMAKAPIHCINSGPALAPIAARAYAALDTKLPHAVVADTGGTSYDVSLVRNGRIPFTRETWLGRPYEGHITGFPAIDVKSIGAGGGSIAWVDPGGLLRVGPMSAGAHPGPVAYGNGGTAPTVTDAAVVLGYIDPRFFLGGSMPLDAAAASRAIESEIAAKLDIDLFEAAAAIMAITTERMVQSIEEITINQGVDPRRAALIGGGGGAGLNAVAIARRLGSPFVLIPETGAALSAAGGLVSDLSAEFASAIMTDTSDFNYTGVNQIIGELTRRCEEFLARVGASSEQSAIEFVLEARYRRQVWQLDLPLRTVPLATPDDVGALADDFHRLHEGIYAVRDDSAAVEIINIRAIARCELTNGSPRNLRGVAVARASDKRHAYFRGQGLVEAAVVSFDDMKPGVVIDGPAIVESPFTTVVVDPGATAERRASRSLVLVPGSQPPARGDGRAAKESVVGGAAS